MKDSTAELPQTKIPLFRFPQGQTGAGGFPPHAAKSAAPPKRDFKSLPLKSPFCISLQKLLPPLSENEINVVTGDTGISKICYECHCERLGNRKGYRREL